jgi:hypothetical protein
LEAFCSRGPVFFFTRIFYPGLSKAYWGKEDDMKKLIATIGIVLLIVVVADTRSEATDRSCFPPPAGLIGWWPGDGDAKDIVSGNDGTPQNEAMFAPGMVQQAFSFDGIDDYISIPNRNYWNFGADDFTIDLWVNFASLPERAPLVDHNEGEGETNKWVLWYDEVGSRDPGGPALRFHINSPDLGPLDTVVYPWSPNTGQWYHVAVTRSGSSYSIYIDGRRVVTEIDANPIPDAEVELSIGQSELYYFFEGQIDEVEIYDHALSPGQIRAIFEAGSAGKCKELPARSCVAPPSDLISWWSGEGNADDRMNNNPGTAENGTTYDQGMVGQAFLFDGVDDYVNVPDSPTLDAITTEITVDFWIKPQQPNKNVWIFARRDPLLSEGFSVLIGPSGELMINLRTVSDLTPYGTVYWAAPIIQFGEWQHVAVTANTELGQVDAYVNGDSVSLEPIYGPHPVSGQLVNVNNLFIGRRQSSDTYEGPEGSGYYAGLLDEVELFSRALSQAEIQAIYYAGSAGKCTKLPARSCFPPPAGLIGWWPGDGNTDDIIGGRSAVLQGDATTGPGFVDQAFFLDGDGDFVDVPHDEALNVGTGDFTVDLWAFFNDTAGEQILVEKWIQRFPEEPDDPGSEGWSLTKLEDNSLLLAMDDGNGEIGVASGRLSVVPFTWNHFAATRKGSKITLFMNGVPVAQGESPLNLDSTSSLKFGHRGNPEDTPGSEDDSGFFLNGRIDEVQIFVGKALTRGQIRAISEAGRAGMCK